MNPEIASLITDLDLSLYSYEKAIFYQNHAFEFTYELGSLSSLESIEGLSVGAWSSFQASGIIRDQGRHAGRFYAAPDIIDIRRTSPGGQDHPSRISENHARLRYRPSNCFVGLFDRVPHQLDLFEDGTA